MLFISILNTFSVHYCIFVHFNLLEEDLKWLNFPRTPTNVFSVFSKPLKNTFSLYLQYKYKIQSIFNVHFNCTRKHIKPITFR